MAPSPTLLQSACELCLCPPPSASGTLRGEAVSVSKFFVLCTASVALLLRLLDVFDSKSSTCGYLAPVSVYRFHKHWRPVLDPAVLALAALCLLLAAAVRQLLRAAAARPVALPLARRRKTPPLPGEATTLDEACGWDDKRRCGKGGRRGAADAQDAGLAQWVVGRSHWLARARAVPQNWVRASLYALALYAAVLVASLGLARSAYPQCRMISLDAPVPATATEPVMEQPGNALHSDMPLQPPYPALDVVVVAIRPTCINQQAVRSVLEHLGPRRILVITPQQHCARFEAYDQRITCLPEHTVVKGVTVPSLAAYLKRRRLSEAHGLHRAGWYMQQFCKLLFYRVVPDLSEHFLIWDSDMIMTRSFRIFNDWGQIRQHTGGIFVQQYASAYHAATGDAMLFGPRWESFVVHHLVVYKPFLREMLRTMGFDEAAADQDPGYLLRWATQLLDPVPDDEMNQGMTEYGAYVSHVLTYHRNVIEVLSRNYWWRDATRYTVPDRFSGNCCPRPDAVASFAKANPQFEFFGYELGHLAECGFEDEKHKNGYFPDEHILR